MEAEMALSWLSDLGKSIFGNMDGLFYTLVAFVVIDYITGVCVAIHNKRLSSDVGAHGIAKKIAIFALVSLSSIIDRFLLGSEDVLRTVTTVFYIANEAMSIPMAAQAQLAYMSSPPNPASPWRLPFPPPKSRCLS